MAVTFYFDVHVPQSIADQLRQRGVDVLTVIEDGRRTAKDEDLLERARELKRVLFTQDIRFKARAEEWQRTSQRFAGLAFGHPLRGTIGQYVRDLELIGNATHLNDWQDLVVYLPL